MIQEELSNDNSQSAENLEVSSPQNTLSLSDLERLRGHYESELRARGVNTDHLLERAELDGIVCTNDLNVFALLNTYFATETEGARETLMVGTPGAFSAESIWKALAEKLGAQKGSHELWFEALKEHLQDRRDETQPGTRGREAYHMAVQFDFLQPVLRMSFELPERLSEKNNEIWNDLLKRRVEYRNEFSDFSDGIDILNEEGLATFAVCCPAIEKVVGDSIVDTLYLVKQER